MKKYIYTGMAIIVFFAIVGIYRVNANPSFFVKEITTSTATTTPKYIPSGGTATSTIVFDAFRADASNNPVNYTAINSALVMIQLAASTTPGTASINIYPQYATGYSGIDCYTNETSCDWYEDGGISPNFATTSKAFDITAATYYTYSFASSTPDKRALSITGQATSTRSFAVKVPTRYMRLVVVSPPGATSLSYWVDIIPMKERP